MQDDNLAPTESMVPLQRPSQEDVSQRRSEREEQRRLSEDFGNMEFEADLYSKGFLDPLSRLGLDAEAAKTVPGNFNVAGLQAREVGGSSTVQSMQANRESLGYTSPIERGDVLTVGDFSGSNTVWTHEFRHRGLEKLLQGFDNDPNSFIEQYLPGADEDTKLVAELVFNGREEELLVDYMDRRSPEELGFDTGVLSDDSESLNERYVQPLSRVEEAIMQAAQDRLIEEGSPPPATMREKPETGWLSGLFQNIFGRNKFAEGGVVSMEEQMSLFDMGGLTDDGAMRDPVSGNEVPPGSMASEVRDDVPAMLSEGEYIVPADVVRYYGVKFFEDLRGQAKSGLMDMERNGRIGGEPVPGPGMEEELSPEEMQMLAELTGMYAGGDVRRPERQSISVDEVLAGNMSVYDAINSPVRVFTPEGMEATTPEMKRELFRNMGLIQTAEESGDQTTRAFQEGGVVTQQDFMNQAQQAEGFRLPSSVFAPSAPTTQPTAPFTPVTLYGPTGDTMLATSQEQYNSLIAQGYTTQPRVTQPAAPTGGDSGGGDGGFGTDDLEAAGGGFRLSDENFESLRNNPLAFGTEALGAELPLGASTRQVAGALSMVAGPVGMIAGGLGGAAFELDNIAKARAALEVARSQDLEGTPEFTALETRLKTAEENLTGPARLLERLGLGSGKSYINQFEEFTSTTPAAPAAARTPTGGGSGVTTTSTPAPERSSVTFASEGPARGTVQGPGQAARPGSRPAPEPGRRGDSAADVEADDAARVSAESRASAQRAAERQGTSLATRGRATGGLVAKPPKKKTVAKKK